MSPHRIHKDVPKLRAEEFSKAPQPGDDERVQYVRRLWSSQDLLLLNRDRQIEENVRMLCGQQWSVFSRLLGRFVDISHYLSEREQAWRQRPVVNRLLLWFMLTHARMTENPPIVAFQPVTGDKADADLAEVLDTVFKSVWNDVGMLEVLDRFTAWLIPGGTAHLKSVVDPNIGDLIEWRGPALLETRGPDGFPEPLVVPDAPFGQDGNPLVQAAPESESGWEVTGKAFAEHEGGIRVDVLNPMQVRMQWGNDVPPHQKRWHIHRSFLTPEEVYDRYGVELDPEVTGEEADAVGSLRRVMFGSGAFRATEFPGELRGAHEREGGKGYVDLMELWQAPSSLEERTMEGPDQAGGRLLAVTRNRVLRDGPRPAKFQYTSPIRTVNFVGLPGRPSGSSPQEALNPIQRAFNRSWGQILEHSNLSANPIGVADKSVGLKDGDITNEPGQWLYVNRTIHGGTPLEYVKPPALGEVVYRSLGLLRDEIQSQGHLEGSQGRPPTRDPSGELIKELRFNDDRFIGPTMRRMALELGRMVEDWIAILPTIWTEEKVVTFAGEDQVLRTAIVAPHLFDQGSVNVQVDIESMLPEGRGERQQKALGLWQQGAYGDPASPEARLRFFEHARFPHLGRMMRPGGVHREMAESENGRLAQGAAAMEIPIYEWQDHETHLLVHEEFMASPDFQRLEIDVQQQFLLHRQWTLQAAQATLGEQLERQAAMEAAAGTAAAEVAGVVGEAQAEFGPQPPSPPSSAPVPAGRPPGESVGRPTPRSA